MADILILYASTEGHTAKMARHMAKIANDVGHQATVMDERHLSADLSLQPYAAVIIGASVHVGKYPEPIRRFVKTYLDQLQAKPTAFFSVSLSIASANLKEHEAISAITAKFLLETGWRPDKTAHFAGALKYSRYGLLKRLLMKRIAKKEGGSTDTFRDHEYTDWEAVSRFVEDFLSSLM